MILAAAGQLLVALAAFGLLTPFAMAAVAIPALVAIVALRPVPLSLLLLLIPVAMIAAYPPLAFDETLYHLPYVDRIARSGTIAVHDDIRFGVFPLLHEALTVPLYRAFGATATHYAGVLQLALLGALLLQWPRTRERGWLAAAIALGNPALIAMSVVNYTDAALTLFVAAGFFCLRQQSDDAALLTPRVALLAGFLLGTGTAVKYQGWYFVAAAVLWTWRRLPHYLLGVTAGAAAMTGCLLALTGNPLHPLFLPGPFAIQDGPVPGSPLLRFARLLYDLTFARERVGWAVPWTPLFAVALLLVIASGRRNWKLTATVLTYLVVFVLILPTDSRYLLPLSPLVAAAAADVAWRVPRRALALATLIAIVPLVLYPVKRMRWKGLPPLRAEARQKLLEGAARRYRPVQVPEGRLGVRLRFGGSQVLRRRPLPRRPLRPILLSTRLRGRRPARAPRSLVPHRPGVSCTLAGTGCRDRETLRNERRVRAVEKELIPPGLRIED